ncbi:MAG: hypothetical protein LUH05_02860 [Candidatus Gastranaerophilales bacterium]|nr:hypothetical protein [Candidatus Gastranaerophilales bacterium]
MITKISSSMAVQNVQSNSSPSFGMARLNTLGRATADTFGYKENQFLDGNMFKKQGIFTKPCLTEKLEAGEDFVTICNDYGCTKNPKTNAEFIKAQILSGKSDKAIKSAVKSKDIAGGLVNLYVANYDNPELSTGSTKALLDLIKNTMKPEEYVQQIGLLEVGTGKEKKAKTNKKA